MIKPLTILAAFAAITGLLIQSHTPDVNKLIHVRYFSLPLLYLPASTNYLSDNQVNYIGEFNPGDNCQGAGKLCIVSIDTAYLTWSKEHILPNMLAPIQTIISTKN